VEAGARKIHELQLDGLVPDTRYRYRVEPSEREDASGAFWTAPSAADPFSFVVLGDTRGHEVHRSIVRQILQLDPAPRFVFNLGDMVNDGKSAPEWQAFFEDVAPLARFVPYYSTLGNHEHDAELYFELFALPRNGPEPERSYSFDWGNTHFTVIDASPKHRDDERQLQWLAQDLERARSATFRIVFFHHSGHGTRPLRAQDHESVSGLLDPYLERGHVDLVFNGHDHSYVRASSKGVDYIVTGGGGAILHELGPPSGDTIVQYKVHNYCVVRVAAEQIEVVALDASGTRIDSLVRKATPASHDRAAFGE
jgi:3',5'-cyclic AMP phosphodiesterase CpdA